MPLDLAALVAPGHTALVLQEVQNGVVGDASALPALTEAAAAVDLIPHCAALARAAARRGSRSSTAPRRPATTSRARTRTRRCSSACGRCRCSSRRAATRCGARTQIGVDPADVVLPRHHGLGPMTGTQLDSMLRNLGVTTIVGVGVSVNIGMTNFAFDAVNRGYQFVMPTDAVAGVPADYAAAVIANTLRSSRPSPRPTPSSPPGPDARAGQCRWTAVARPRRADARGRAARGGAGCEWGSAGSIAGRVLVLVVLVVHVAVLVLHRRRARAGDRGGP